jgi:hypothetical protein
VSENCIKSDQINEDWNISTQDQSLLGLKKHCTTISLANVTFHYIRLMKNSVNGTYMYDIIW